MVSAPDVQTSVPADNRIVLLRNRDGGGPARSRQLGIDAASGSVIALLDDDDVWSPTKLACQLAVAESVDTDHWIVSSRMLVQGPGNRQRMWPRRLIEPGESVAEYLFRFNGLGFGNANLQTSTLCFPTALARRVPWGGPSDEPHDEPSWLIRAQRAIPDLRVVQLRRNAERVQHRRLLGIAGHLRSHRCVYTVGLALFGYGVAASARRLPVYKSGQRGGVGTIVERFASGRFVCGATWPARPLRDGVRGSQRGKNHPAHRSLGDPAMTEPDRLAPEERRALLYGPLYRIVGTPVVALLGLLNTAIIVRETGEAVYGLVSLVATITLLFPFADLGIGATVLSASAMLVGKRPRSERCRRHSSRLPRPVQRGRCTDRGRGVHHGFGRLGRCRRLRERSGGSLGYHDRSMRLRAHDSGRPWTPHPGRYRPQSAGDAGADELSGVRSRIDVSPVRHRCERHLVCRLVAGWPAHRADRRHSVGASPVRPRVVGVFQGFAVSARLLAYSRAVCGSSWLESACQSARRADGFCSPISPRPPRCPATH